MVARIEWLQVFQEKINHLHFTMLLHSSMKNHLVLPMTKWAITGVCSVGNVEVGIIEIGKEPWKISLDGKVSTAKSLMFPSPFAFEIKAFGSFFDEFSPFLMPSNQFFCEFLSCCFRDCECNHTEFFTGIQLWTLCELLSDSLELMVLTVLYGYVWIELL